MSRLSVIILGAVALGSLGGQFAYKLVLGMKAKTASAGKS